LVALVAVDAREISGHALGSMSEIGLTGYVADM
jgi:hypothetical protein